MSRRLSLQSAKRLSWQLRRGKDRGMTPMVIQPAGRLIPTLRRIAPVAVMEPLPALPPGALFCKLNAAFQEFGQ